jgi:hypothetical protein
MVSNFLSGAITMGFLLGGLFFVRFWRETRDQLFLTFAVAFWLLAIVQALLALGPTAPEERSWLYGLRLLAFLLIAGSIIRKNRRP